MKFHHTYDVGYLYSHRVSFRDKEKLALIECLKRGINCWTDVEKADAIRKLIDEMENAK